MKINAFWLGPPAKFHEFLLKINTFWLGPPVWLGPPAKFNQFLMKINAFWLGPPVLPPTQAHLKLNSSLVSTLQSSVVEEVGGRGGSL